MLSIDDLHTVLTATWEARAKWYNCGLAFGLTAGTLDALSKSYRGDCDECYTETLKKWLKGTGLQPTLHALSNALENRSVGHVELVERIRKFLVV